MARSERGADWVLTQVRLYPVLGAAGGGLWLPQVVFVHPSQARVLELLETSVRLGCGAYEEKRLVARGGRLEYEPPGGAGAFAVVRARSGAAEGAAEGGPGDLA